MSINSQFQNPNVSSSSTHPGLQAAVLADLSSTIGSSLTVKLSEGNVDTSIKVSYFAVVDLTDVVAK